MDPKELGNRSAFPMAMIEHTVNSPGLTKRERIAQLAIEHADALLTELAKEST